MFRPFYAVLVGIIEGAGRGDLDGLSKRRYYFEVLFPKGVGIIFFDMRYI